MLTDARRINQAIGISTGIIWSVKEENMIKRHTKMTYETFDKDGTLLTRSVTVSDEEEDGITNSFNIADEDE